MKVMATKQLYNRLFIILIDITSALIYGGVGGAFYSICDPIIFLCQCYALWINDVACICFGWFALSYILTHTLSFRLILDIILCVYVSLSLSLSLMPPCHPTYSMSGLQLETRHRCRDVLLQKGAQTRVRFLVNGRGRVFVRVVVPTCEVSAIMSTSLRCPICLNVIVLMRYCLREQV